MSYPISTGQVRQLLNCPEHKLQSLIRQNHLTVPLIDGTRAWSAENVLDAARFLKCGDEILERIQADQPTKTEA